MPKSEHKKEPSKHEKVRERITNLFGAMVKIQDGEQEVRTFDNLEWPLHGKCLKLGYEAWTQIQTQDNMRHNDMAILEKLEDDMVGIRQLIN